MSICWQQAVAMVLFILIPLVGTIYVVMGTWKETVKVFGIVGLITLCVCGWVSLLIYSLQSMQCGGS